MCFPGGSEGKVSTWNMGDRGLIPGLGRSPGGEHGNPLRYSCLENPTDRGAWWAAVHEVTKSRKCDNSDSQVTAMVSVSQFSLSVVSDSLRPHESQHARPPCPSQTPGVYSNSCPSSQWYHPAISSSVIPFSSCPQSIPASGSFPTSQLFAWGGQSIGVSASASVWTPRNDLLQDGLVGSPCSPRDSQESSPTPQLKSISSSVLSFLHSPTLTSIHDQWKNHSPDQMGLCWQSNVSAF